MAIRLYLAGLGSSTKMMEFVAALNETLPEEEKLGVMTTYAYPGIFAKTLRFGAFKHIMLDSGAFTAFEKGIEIDIDDYAAFVNEHKDVIDSAITLDVIGDGDATRRNWEYLRDVKGLDVVPAYSAGIGWEYLQYYYNRADYITIGGMAGGTVNPKSLISFFTDLFHRFPNRKYHPLGINSLPVIQRFPFYSCDALTWRNGSRFGQLVLPKTRFHLGSHKSGLSKHRIQALGLQHYFDEFDITLPFPDDFDWTLIDRINIKILVKEIVQHEIDNMSVARRKKAF